MQRHVLVGVKFLREWNGRSGFLESIPYNLRVIVENVERGFDWQLPPGVSEPVINGL